MIWSLQQKSKNLGGKKSSILKCWYEQILQSAIFIQLINWKNINTSQEAQNVSKFQESSEEKITVASRICWLYRERSLLQPFFDNSPVLFRNKTIVFNFPMPIVWFDQPLVVEVLEVLCSTEGGHAGSRKRRFVQLWFRYLSLGWYFREWCYQLRS